MFQSNKNKKKLSKMDRIVRFISIAMVLTMLVSLIISFIYSLNSFF
ncbi:MULTISPECIES: DUF4044 domain-containing protein [Globicatella]|nr:MULTISPECIES: DUF4044 domain-containing protein [Globicatella]MDK7630662.1 DUF4044 domain-containing protein [Globicatella sanguinis]WIK66611.1 DUF4044 domain-containing protein [Globicatella sanguinis]WKT56016.1 DUF4044 domain-containing protein [Globicatella sanguinis]WPC08570.1 DUF4044 domain-containing protein [Globicatella sp. PHS-GS-PNBC-21-1553]